jgi:hypothetical protein
MDSGLATVNGVKTNEGINFEVREMKININRVESDEEVDERLTLLLRDMFEKGGGNGGA